MGGSAAREELGFDGELQRMRRTPGKRPANLSRAAVGMAARPDVEPAGEGEQEADWGAEGVGDALGEVKPQP